MGDKARAVTEARAALEMAPHNVHPGIQRYGQALAARIFAWADAHDESIALLEQMSSQYPMIGPAEITRDPLYAIPLAGNPRYRKLETRLDAENCAEPGMEGSGLARFEGDQSISGATPTSSMSAGDSATCLPGPFCGICARGRRPGCAHFGGDGGEEVRAIFPVSGLRASEECVRSGVRCGLPFL
jgi:hypothetical protein